MSYPRVSSNRSNEAVSGARRSAAKGRRGTDHCVSGSVGEGQLRDHTPTADQYANGGLISGDRVGELRDGARDVLISDSKDRAKEERGSEGASN